MTENLKLVILYLKQCYRYGITHLRFFLFCHWFIRLVGFYGYAIKFFGMKMTMFFNRWYSLDKYNKCIINYFLTNIIAGVTHYEQAYVKITLIICIFMIDIFCFKAAMAGSPNEFCI